VQEAPIQIASGDAVLTGHVGGKGAPALLLHGGPGVPDYTGPCAAELGTIFTTIRYTQRGTPPSTGGPPFTIEAHMADALAVLDALALDRAWAVGHSWGGHLALHLAVAHPDRLHGIVCIDTLGASDEIFPDFHEALSRDLDDDQRARLQEIREHRADGTVTEEELLEELATTWPAYFFDPATAPPLLAATRGVECTLGTNRSISEHFERKTLEEGLPNVRLPALFVHALNDPLPVRASVDTSKLLPGSKVARITRCGHFPWIEQPGVLPRMVRGLFAQL
jgi:proline iminopeptidase